MSDSPEKPMSEYRRGLEAAKEALHEATVGIRADEHTVVSVVGLCWRSVQRLINKDDDESGGEPLTP